MTTAKYQTMRHIETVRNYINAVIKLFMERGENHDQSKLKQPEAKIFEEFTPKLKNCTYGSDEYTKYLDEMTIGLIHHYAVNRHHPEFFDLGIDEMNLIDLTEMLLDWKAASLRHADGNIWDSIEMNQKRFGYSDEMKGLLKRTMLYIEQSTSVIHDVPSS